MSSVQHATQLNATIHPAFPLARIHRERTTPANLTQTHRSTPAWRPGGAEDSPRLAASGGDMYPDGKITVLRMSAPGAGNARVVFPRRPRRVPNAGDADGKDDAEGMGKMGRARPRNGGLVSEGVRYMNRMVRFSYSTCTVHTWMRAACLCLG